MGKEISLLGMGSDVLRANMSFTFVFKPKPCRSDDNRCVTDRSTAALKQVMTQELQQENQELQ